MNRMLRSADIPLATAFADVDTWVFDLDNTLYPHHANLWEQVDNRITTWIANYFGIDGLTARALQKYYYRRHGTSLRGLMIDEGLAPEAFLDFAHDIDHSPLAPDPALDAALAALPGRRLIFTSGSCKHADNVVKRLGCLGRFEAVFDIVAADYEPKPARATYERFFARHNIEPRRAAMFEDLERNLIVPDASGMRTVLVVPQSSKTIEREDWELAGLAAPHVHFVTDDLARFLGRLTSGEGLA